MEFKGMGLVFLFFLCFLCGRCFSSVQDKIELINQENGSLNFLVIGDWGRKGSYNQSEVAYQLGRIGEELQVEFIVSTGDNFYEDGLTNVTDKSFRESFSDIYTAKSLQKPWYAVLGNHDYRGDVLAQLSPILRSLDHRWNCKRSFTLRRSLAAGSVDLFFVDTTPFVAKYWKIPNEHTYDWRGVAPKEAYVNRQLKELAMSLEESNATWKIVIGHHTIRSVGHHGDTEELLQQLLPILETHNVDLYINGHDHCLEHIKSVTSDLQFLTSGGGSKSWRGIDNDANMKGLEMYYDGQGFLSLQITPTNIEAAFYDIEGIVIHQVELYKSDLKHLLQNY